MIFRINGGKVLTNQWMRISKSFLRQISIGCREISEREITPGSKKSIERHWRERISHGEFNEASKKEKIYILSMFPYPSGNLHMGHVRVYTISDAMARFYRMSGKEVLHPMGWDAFGLPAENAARQRGIPAAEWTEKNIKTMKDQLIRLGCSFDWTREIATCHPDYYRWTQWLFLQLYREGLTYQREAMVNWDPVDETVLANEQVDANGCSWRSGAKVEKRLLKQWFIRTTRYCKELTEGLDNPLLQDWKDIIDIQKHWLGECDGFSFDLDVVSKKPGLRPVLSTISLWHSRPEALKSVSFIGIREDHPLAKDSGDLVVKNPFTGHEIPLVITEDGEFPPNCDAFLGISGESEANREEILRKAKELGIGGFPVSSKLRDWLISRQRSWGTPIPIIHCQSCGAVPVPEDQLPVTLADVQEGDKVSCPKCQNPEARREKDTMDTFVDSSWYFLRYLDPSNSQQIFRKDLSERMMPVDLYIGGKEHAELHLYFARFVTHFLHSLGLVPETEPFRRLLVQGMVMGRSFRVKGSGKYIPESEVDVIDEKRNKAVEKATGNPVVVSWEKMSKSKLNGVDPEDVIEELGIDTTRLVILGDVAPFSHRNWSRTTFPGMINWQRRLWMTVHDFSQLKNDAKAGKVLKKGEKFDEEEAKLKEARNYYLSKTNWDFRYTHNLSGCIRMMQGLTNPIRQASQDVVQSGPEFQRALGTQIVMLAPLAPHLASELWVRFVEAAEKTPDSAFAWDRDVLDQHWPEVDQDFELNLVAKVNGLILSSAKFPRWKLDQMTKEEAAEIAQNQPKVVKFIGSKKILDTVVKFYPGVGIRANVIVERSQNVKEKVQEDCENIYKKNK